jgi:hypothetical protein
MTPKICKKLSVPLFQLVLGLILNPYLHPLCTPHRRTCLDLYLFHLFLFQTYTLFFLSLCHSFKITSQHRCRCDHHDRGRKIFLLCQDHLHPRVRHQLDPIRPRRRLRDGADFFVFLSDAPFSAIWHGDFGTKPEMH